MVLVRNQLFLFVAECNQIDAVLGEHEEVVVREEEAANRRLPELVALIPILDQETVHQIKAKYVESVKADHLVADNNRVDNLLFAILVCNFVMHDSHFTIVNVQFVVPTDQVLLILLYHLLLLVKLVYWIILIKLVKVEAKSLIKLISKDVKVFLINADRLDARDAHIIVEVDF